MSDRKRKIVEPVDPSDPHLREAHLIEGAEKHVPPLMAPVSVAPMPSQLIAPIPLLPPEVHSGSHMVRTEIEESLERKKTAGQTTSQ